MNTVLVVQALLCAGLLACLIMSGGSAMIAMTPQLRACPRRAWRQAYRWLAASCFVGAGLALALLF